MTQENFVYFLTLFFGLILEGSVQGIGGFQVLPLIVALDKAF